MPQFIPVYYDIRRVPTNSEHLCPVSSAFYSFNKPFISDLRGAYTSTQLSILFNGRLFVRIFLRMCNDQLHTSIAPL